jgi:hypothetical protein
VYDQLLVLLPQRLLLLDQHRLDVNKPTNTHMGSRTATRFLRITLKAQSRVNLSALLNDCPAHSMPCCSVRLMRPQWGPVVLQQTGEHT